MSLIKHVVAGTQLKVVGALLPLVATVVLVVAGSGLTGPSMNPAHAFSWNYYLQVLTSHDPAAEICFRVSLECMRMCSSLRRGSTMHCKYQRIISNFSLLPGTGP